MKCPDCSSNIFVMIGFIVTKASRKQRYRCNKCGRTFYAKVEYEGKVKRVS